MRPKTSSPASCPAPSPASSPASSQAEAGAKEQAGLLRLLRFLRRSFSAARSSRAARAAAAVLLTAAVASAVHWTVVAGDPAPAAKPASVLAAQLDADPGPWAQREFAASDLERHVQAAKVAHVVVDGDRAFFTLRDGTRGFSRFAGGSSGLRGRLEELSADKQFTLVAAQVDTRTFGERVGDTVDALVPVLIRALTVLLFAGLGLLTFLQVKGSGLLGSRIAAQPAPADRFDGVIGANDAKLSLQRVKAFLTDPQKYAQVGAVPPRGVLLAGPPGTGKTLLARALAGECGASFLAIDGSYFSSTFMGQGPAKVKELFAQARASAPCVIFIDEIDGIGQRKSGPSLGPGQGEENRIINRLLVEMDGFERSEGIVVVAATNHIDNVDPALRRPGRFDLVATLGLPTVSERQALFELCTQGLQQSGDLDSRSLARQSPGMSPADIRGVCNRAASMAAEANRGEVSQADFLRALSSVQLGAEAGSARVSEATRRRVAVHEAGHALVGHVCGAGDVGRVSIEPRGFSLGATYVSPLHEDPLMSAPELKARLALSLAGRRAELAVLGNASSGAADDLRRATELAYAMVSQYGLGDRLGCLSVAGLPSAALGPGLQDQLLGEARELLAQADDRCANIVETHRAVLDALTQALLDDELVEGENLASILAPASRQA